MFSRGGSSFAFQATIPEGFKDLDDTLGAAVVLPGMVERLRAARMAMHKREASAAGYKVSLSGLRRASGLSQKELADAVGTSQPVISFYESGERELTLHKAQLIADALGVDIGTLAEAARNV